VLVLGRAFIAVKISAAQLPSKEHDLRLSLLCTLIC
jgi:hypothetical protein